VFECEITECRTLITGIFEGRLKGRKEEGPWHVPLDLWGGGGERLNRQKTAQNCVSKQATASPFLSHVFAAVRSLIKNTLSRKSTHTPASWRQQYEISQQGLEPGSLNKPSVSFY
jgi:hypothetical protein